MEYYTVVKKNSYRKIKRRITHRKALKANKKEKFTI